MLIEGTDNGNRLEARRSVREAQVLARLFLAVGVGVGLLALFVDWRVSFVPVLVGLALYFAVQVGGPKAGEYIPLTFAIDQRGIQIGETSLIPWSAISAVRLQSKVFGARGAYLVIDLTDTGLFESQANAWERVERVFKGQQSVSVLMAELDVGPKDVRTIVRQYRPNLLGSENPLFRA